MSDQNGTASVFLCKFHVPADFPGISRSVPSAGRWGAPNDNCGLSSVDMYMVTRFYLSSGIITWSRGLL